MKGLLSVPYASQDDAYMTTPIAAETEASYQTTDDRQKRIKRLKELEPEIAIPPT